MSTPPAHSKGGQKLRLNPLIVVLHMCQSWAMLLILSHHNRHEISIVMSTGTHIYGSHDQCLPVNEGKSEREKERDREWGQSERHMCLSNMWSSCNLHTCGAVGSPLSKLLIHVGVIIGPKSYKNDVYPRYFQNYWPKPKKLNTSTPKPQTRDIGEPFYGNGPTESPK